MKIVFNRFAKSTFLGLLLSCFAGLASAAGGVMTSFGTRGTVTPTTPMYGSFAVTTTSAMHIAVRGPSLKTLGVNQNPLDLPYLRIYDSAGKDILFTSGVAGASGCPSTGTSSGVTVSNYYAKLGQPLDVRDTCVSGTYAAGVYTFTINPSTLSSSLSGELLFEVRLNPDSVPAASSTIYEQEPNDQLSNATPVLLYSTVVGNLSSTRDVDYFVFYAPTAGRYTLTYTPLSPVNSYTYPDTFSIISASGVTLTSGDFGSTPASHGFTVGAPGNIYVKVYFAGGFLGILTTDDYEFQITN